MKIAIVNPSNLAHRVRGTGFYLSNLKASLEKYYPQNSYELVSNISGNFDIIHYPFFEPFFQTLPLFRKNKTVVTIHDLTPLVFSRNFPSGLKGYVRWKLQKIALKNVNGVITDSNSSKNDIIKYAGVSLGKIKVIYLAAGEEFRKINNENELEKTRKKYKLPEKFVLYVGDATWNKNLPRLIKSMEKIDANLVMAGEALVKREFDRKNPWNRDLLEVQKFSEGNFKIIRLGFIPTLDLVKLYNLATVFVMPSLYEGFGLPVLEAMSCGCPVVTSKSGSLFEVTQNCVYYVDPYSIDSISDGIKKVFSDSKLQHELSQKGLVQAKKFSWKKTASQTLDFYKKS